MKFIVIFKQKSEGCDYSIGCGVRCVFFEAETKEKAVEEILDPESNKDHGMVYFGGAATGELESIRLIEIKNEYDLIPMAFEQLRADKEAESKRQAQETEDKGKAMLEQLKAKYERKK